MVTTNLSGTYTITAGKIALVIKPGVILTGPGTASTAIFADTKNNDLSHIFTFSNNGIGGGGRGIIIIQSDNNSLTDVIAADNVSIGVNVTRSSNNTLSNITAINNRGG
ncbi:MAG TPA: hypothetical protein ENI65_00510, partial [Gammaproteobacteria bacterium]|nr:hypothetical protein [Gammaproteobacteria bacterium]